jgi:hypothetical protein|tara:strand:+ start:10290 stop:10865 length:576 start_codon:yes stop_codon:yes gene_type:complete
VRIKLEKRGIRALGISESFKKEIGTRSILGGVVMRSDLIVDGLLFGVATLEGDDATDAILSMVKRLNRNDINIIIISGAIISLYNIIDIDRVGQETGIPIICITFEESGGLVQSIKRHFPKKWEKKVEEYKKLDRREVIYLKTGYRIFARTYGLDIDESKKVLDKFILQGAVPEPVRLARLLAKAKLETIQ